MTVPAVVAVAARKGGVGKTTIAINLAVEAAAEGREVRVLDIDPQGSAALWADERADGQGGGASAVDVRVGLARRIDEDIKAAAGGGVELVLVDTAAGVDDGTLAAARASDLVVIPCRASLFDLAAVMRTVDVARLARTQVAVALNFVRARGAETGEARGILRERGIDVLESTLGQRVAVVHAQTSGLGVREFDAGGLAAQELRGLWGEIRARVGAGRRRAAARRTDA